MPNVAIVDYGGSNLLSVQRAINKCNSDVFISSNPQLILKASHVLLPGVGAVSNAMSALKRDGLDQVIKEVASQGTPLLGICLGMQLLLEESEEFGLTPTLGLIKGRVVPIPNLTTFGLPLKIPNIGWSRIHPPNTSISWTSSILDRINTVDSFYFVHSYMACPRNREDILAVSNYGGNMISAALNVGNVFGCQFHPEKSGEIGLKVLNNFINL